MLFDSVSKLIMEAGNPPYRCVTTTQKPVLMNNLNGAVIAIMRGQRHNVATIRPIEPQDVSGDTWQVSGDNSIEAEAVSNQAAISRGIRANRNVRNGHPMPRTQQTDRDTIRRTGGFEGMPFSYDEAPAMPSGMLSQITRPTLETTTSDIAELSSRLHRLNAQIMSGMPIESMLLVDIKPLIVGLITHGTPREVRDMYRSLQDVILSTTQFRGGMSPDDIVNLRVCSKAIELHMTLEQDVVMQQHSRVLDVIKHRRRVTERALAGTPSSDESKQRHLVKVIGFMSNHITSLEVLNSPRTTSYIVWLFDKAVLLQTTNSHALLSAAVAVSNWAKASASLRGSDINANTLTDMHKSMTTIFALNGLPTIRNEMGSTLMIGQVRQPSDEFRVLQNVLAASYVVRLRDHVIRELSLVVNSETSVEYVGINFTQLVIPTHIARFLSDVTEEGCFGQENYHNKIQGFCNDISLLNPVERAGITLFHNR